MKRASTALALAAILASASVARAQTAEDRAAADALYTESGKLIAAGHFAEACPKLEASDRLDPGIGTAIRLGYCYEHLGRTASAWSAYNEATTRARKANDKRADDADGRAKALEPKLSRLLITLKNPAPGEHVQRDGKDVDAALWGSAIPVDPGEHTLEASAPGRRTWTTKVTAAGPGTTTVEVPALVEGPSDAPPAASPFWGGQRIAGAVIGGAGLVTIAVSLGLGASAKSSNSDSLSYCPSDPGKCYAPGVTLRNNALSTADVATGVFVAGAVALGTGLVTFFTVPSAKKPTTGIRSLRFLPAVGAGGGSMAVRGTW